MTNKVAYIFPPQNSQYVGMGKKIAQSYPEANAVFTQANEILGEPLSTLCWEGPEADLNDTYNTQPALFVASYACLKALEAAGVPQQPNFVAGHSLGEFSAYAAAGIVSFEDGLKLVRERGRLMKKAGEIRPGKMAAILMLPDEQVADICTQATEEAGWVQVANYNNPGQVVISGEEEGIDRAIELALAAKARRAQKLAVSIAAHSKLMAVIQDEFKEIVESTPLTEPHTPLIANITAKPLQSVTEVRQEMVGQLTASVQWTKSIQYMVSQGVTEFVEIGAKNALSGMIRRIDKTVTRTVIDTLSDLEKYTP
ncbi:MAG: ACP S-malonyltransferase [Chloroflexota bacterium]